MSLFIASCFFMITSAQAAPSPIEAQIQSLRTVLTGLSFDEGQKKPLAINLDLSANAAKSGDSALALYYIRSTMPNLLSYSAIENEKQYKDVADLDKYLKAQEPAYQAGIAAIGKSGYTKLPMASRGLIEEALTQAETLHRTGILFGKETDVSSGIFYIRQATAFLEFANLVAAETHSAEIQEPALVGMADAQEMLRGDIIDAYIAHGGGDEPAKPLIVTAHSRMKIADDLLSEKRPSGAAMVIIQGKFELALALAMIGKVQVDSAQLPALLQKLRDEAKALPDPSIALVYINLADDKLKAGQESDLIRAKVLIEDVIPFALEVLK